jgi:hypothetical protein
MSENAEQIHGIVCATVFRPLWNHVREEGVHDVLKLTIIQLLTVISGRIPETVPVLIELRVFESIQRDLMPEANFSLIAVLCVLVSVAVTVGTKGDREVLLQCVSLTDFMEVVDALGNEPFFAEVHDRSDQGYQLEFLLMCVLEVIRADPGRKEELMQLDPDSMFGGVTEASDRVFELIHEPESKISDGK